MGEVERPQAGAERGDLDHRRAAVLGRDVALPEVQAPDVGRERVAPDDPDRDRRDAILGRQRDTGQERSAVGAERDIAARDGEGRDQGRRESILGRGRDSAPERGQGRDRDRDRDRDRER